MLKRGLTKFGYQFFLVFLSRLPTAAADGNQPITVLFFFLQCKYDRGPRSFIQVVRDEVTDAVMTSYPDVLVRQSTVDDTGIGKKKAATRSQHPP